MTVMLLLALDAGEDEAAVELCLHGNYCTGRARQRQEEPMVWKLVHRKGDLVSARGDYGVHQDTVYSRPGFQAGDGFIMSNAHQVRECRHTSGSGPLNGEKEWPHVTLDVSFPTGWEGHAEKLSKELRDFLDRFLQENDLETGDSP